MNGGTNIALAIQRAGQLLKPLGPGVRRALVLLTDGRVDSHQARLPSVPGRSSLLQEEGTLHGSPLCFLLLAKSILSIHTY